MVESDDEKLDEEKIEEKYVEKNMGCIAYP